MSLELFELAARLEAGVEEPERAEEREEDEDPLEGDVFEEAFIMDYKMKLRR